MSNELVCPFCQRKLEDQWVGQNVAHQYFDCPKCKINGNPKLWQELIRTRKALDVAKDTFNWIDETYRTGQEMEAEIWGKVQLAAQKITALEQKDVK